MHRTALALLLLATIGAARGEALTLAPCRLAGIESDARCASLRRPLDPTAPGAASIEVHVAVLPALARNKKPDPVFFFAGGPGQSAIDLAGIVSRLLARLGYRRDIVLIDQRGTGRSASLACDQDDATLSLREALDEARRWQRLDACRKKLQALPHGDLRHYATPVAMQDADAIRAALGFERINLVGASYGTRAVLEYQRQFPNRVRRAVIDGVAPPDMVLPQSFAIDTAGSLDSLLSACDAEGACRQRHPQLRRTWQDLLSGLPREVKLTHPTTNIDERVTLTRDAVFGMLRQALYSPVLASALPQAIADAAEGRFAGLMGLGMSLGSGRRLAGLAQGMHLSVICTEDVPRMAEPAASAPHALQDLGFAAFYRRACADWPRGPLPPGFYTIAPAPGPVLVLSGGIDPATPPRHGERVARALGDKARHVVIAQGGHGVMGLGCMRDVLYRFLDADDDAQALAVDASCATGIPRPPTWTPARAPEAAR